MITVSINSMTINPQSVTLNIHLEGELNNYGRGIHPSEWAIIGQWTPYRPFSSFIHINIIEDEENIPDEDTTATPLHYDYYIAFESFYNTIEGHETTININGNYNIEVYPLRDNSSYTITINSCFYYYEYDMIDSYRDIISVISEDAQEIISTPPILIGKYANYNLELTDAEKGINATYLYNLLKGKGWTREATAGMLACFDCSCGLNPCYQLFNPLILPPFYTYDAGNDLIPVNGDYDINFYQRATGGGTNQRYYKHYWLNIDSSSTMNIKYAIGGMLPFWYREYAVQMYNPTKDNYHKGLMPLEYSRDILANYPNRLPFQRATNPWTGQVIHNVKEYSKLTTFPYALASLWWDAFEIPYYFAFTKNNACLQYKSSYWYDFLEEPAPTKRRRMPLWEKLKWSL